MASLSGNELSFRAYDSNGNPVSGARLFVYLAGTTTAATAYTDAGLTTPAASPLLSNAAGIFVPLYVADGTYKVDIQDSGGASLPGFPQDNIEALDVSTGTLEFGNRAAAIAATIPAGIQKIEVLTPSGRMLEYTRDASGTALTSADGQKWSPANDVTPQHWAENTTPGTTDMAAAIESAGKFAAITGQDRHYDSRDVNMLGETLAIGRTVYFNGLRNIILTNGTAVAIAGSWTASIFLSETFDGVSDVDTGADTITITGHGFSDDDLVRYRANNGTVVAGLNDTAQYYVVNATANTVQLSATQSGPAINLTAAGTGAFHTLVRGGDFYDRETRGNPMFSVADNGTQPQNVRFIEMGFDGAGIAPGFVHFDDTQHACAVVDCRGRACTEFGILSTTKSGDLTITGNQFAQFYWGQTGWDIAANRTADLLDIRTTDTRVIDNTLFYCNIPLIVRVPGGTCEISNNKCYNGGITGNVNGIAAKVRAQGGRIWANYFGPGIVEIEPDTIISTGGYERAGIVYSGNFHLHDFDTTQRGHVAFQTRSTSDDFEGLSIVGNLFQELGDELASDIDVVFEGILGGSAAATDELQYECTSNISAYIPAAGTARETRFARGLVPARVGSVTIDASSFVRLPYGTIRNNGTRMQIVPNDSGGTLDFSEALEYDATGLNWRIGFDNNRLLLTKVATGTVASLPSASAVPVGSRGWVTDATQTVSAGHGATVAGSGANSVPVFTDGTNWIIG